MAPGSEAEEMRIARGREKPRAFAVGRGRPLIARPVGIKFEAVAIRIGEIDRFAYTVIGKAVEFGAALRGEAQPRAECGTRGQEECRVEKARGIAGCRRRRA